MQWAGSRRRWESACSRKVLDIVPADYNPDADWPLRTVGYDERLVPWCSQCVTAVQRQVDDLVNHVLWPARTERQS